VLDEVRTNYGVVRDHVEREKARGCEKAVRRAEELRRMLAPAWQDRDDAKRSMGEERWTNNPNPKNEESSRRRPLEMELRAIEKLIAKMPTYTVGGQVRVEAEPEGEDEPQLDPEPAIYYG